MRRRPALDLQYVVPSFDYLPATKKAKDGSPLLGIDEWLPIFRKTG